LKIIYKSYWQSAKFTLCLNQDKGLEIRKGAVKMRNDKYQRAINTYNGFKGNQSLQAVWEQIPDSLK